MPAVVLDVGAVSLTGLGVSPGCSVRQVRGARCLLLAHAGAQVPIPRWHEVIGDMTLGDAILDRVVHRAHRLELKGASLRKRRTVTEALTADASE